MGKLHRIKNQQRLIEIFKDRVYDQVHESCVARRQCLNLVTCDVSTLIPCVLVQIQPKESQETQGDRSVSQIPHPPPPHPLSSHKLKKPINYLLIDICLLPQHFIFSLLATFSPRFLPPPYSVPLPSVSLIGVATRLLGEGEVNRLGD